MKEKVKKVIIQDDTSPYVFLIVAMFCTILFIMLVIHHSFDLLEAEVVTFIPMTIFWNEFIKTLKKRSLKDFKTEVNEDSNILTLSTCANNDKYRVVLHAVKIK